MLTKDDLKDIGLELGKVIEDNINPQFEAVDKQFGSVNLRLDQMVTKSYLDDKLAELEGSVIVRQRKEDRKVNLLIELLRRKSVLEESDLKELREIQVFPNLPVDSKAVR